MGKFTLGDLREGRLFQKGRQRQVSWGKNVRFPKEETETWLENKGLVFSGRQACGRGGDEAHEEGGSKQEGGSKMPRWWAWPILEKPSPEKEGGLDLHKLWAINSNTTKTFPGSMVPFLYNNQVGAAMDWAPMEGYQVLQVWWIQGLGRGERFGRWMAVMVVWKCACTRHHWAVRLEIATRVNLMCLYISSQ